MDIMNNKSKILNVFRHLLTIWRLNNFVKVVFYYFTSVAKGLIKIYYQLFHDEGPYHIETSPLSCRVNQWTGFYMIRTSVMKELKRY